MDHTQFDDLSRRLASTLSRRQALKVFGASLVSAFALPLTGARAAGQSIASTCTAFCNDTFLGGRGLTVSPRRPAVRGLALFVGQPRKRGCRRMYVARVPVMRAAAPRLSHGAWMVSVSSLHRRP